ncbi:hypothetical protein K505DRAFT_320977 [Melanomma pulvis-pyrius CBS 109.77]|uniref:Opioid growth factor receptor (OGFr) conserved domain-containing protein n=1 Tax=Melanomma pulvis-pyrius CBS 109.77 TaxID=1314802 RepID=A0A6A6XTV2_9PLEO|nr:hypothetical protein K505DRAFT_320977 [Melanomma pulvis-pyrius CBS 109.77]
MYYPEREADKHRLRSAFAHILKRRPTTNSKPNPKPKSIRYENTSTPTATYKTPDLYPTFTMAPSNPFQFFRSKTEDSMEGPKKESLVIRFYDPDVKATDSRGRDLEYILGWGDRQLEQCHDYIQMLFPLPEGSPYNWAAPVINREVLEAFRSRSELRDALRRSLVRILDFYGFEVVSEEEAEEIAKANELAKAKEESKVEGKDEDETEEEQYGNILVQPNSAVHGLAEDGTHPNQLPNDDLQTSTNAQEPQPQQIEAHSDATMASNSATPADQPTEPSANLPTATDPITEPAIAPESKLSTGLTSGFVVIRAAHWPQNSRNWAIRFDHNHLRITRILRCLRVLGLQVECDAFYSALKDVYNDPSININQRSMSYWRKAVRQPLYIAPDGDRVMWLKRWEEEHAEAAEQKSKDEAEEEESSEDEVVSKKVKVDKAEHVEGKPSAESASSKIDASTVRENPDIEMADPKPSTSITDP